MRNVKRLKKPDSLKNNGSRWASELRDHLDHCSCTGDKVDDKYYDRYNTKSVKETLKEMSNELCCYCEARTGVVEFGNIEHLKPKKKFPKYTYDWENLHLICTACNTMKGEKYDSQYPILAPVNDIPIAKDLTYRFNELGVWRDWKTMRGKTTADDPDLNRDDLRDVRTKVFLKALELVNKMNNNADDPNIAKIRQELDVLCRGEYGSVISFVMEEFLHESLQPEKSIE